MFDKVLRSLVLVAVTLALSRTGALGREGLPPRALARIGDHRFYHGPHVCCAVLSPDGCCAASSSHGQVIILWDAATGEHLRELNTPDGPIWCLAFSPEGKRLAAAYKHHPFGPFGVAIFEVETGRLVRRLENFENEVDYLQFSPDGKQLRIGEQSGPVSTWNPSNGKQLRLWKPPSNVPSKGDKAHGFAIRGTPSPDGTVIVWGIGPFERKTTSTLETAVQPLSNLPSKEDKVQNTPLYSVVLRAHDAATDKLLYQKEITLRVWGNLRTLATLAFSADSKRFATGIRTWR